MTDSTRLRSADRKPPTTPSLRCCQATEGQGGYYGSGGSRVIQTSVQHRPEALADLSAMERLEEIMNEVEELETAAVAEEGSLNDVLLQNKAAVKELVTSSEMTNLLSRLEMNGQPKWGLSTREREIVKSAREKIDYM
eukprot:scaffold2963_cov250-Pinguiococcus_pyrenoidosus.AAC.1